MKQFLTDKATKSSWWEWPVMVFSGLLTVMGLHTVATDFWYGDPFTDAIAAVLFLALLSWPLFLTARKRRRRAQALTIAKCLGRLRNSFVTFGELGRRANILAPEKKLEWMISKGWIQNVALDREHACVRVVGTDKPESVPEKQPPEAPVPEAVYDDIPVTGNKLYDAKLREIRGLNVRIEDAAVSAKIDRIEALTADIFQRVADHPERADEIRRFVNYYLPTTLKLLESYDLMEDQHYQGENIRASRAQIEAVLDQIIQAVERQQDKLFQSDALDVETDISVLKTMMSADGLTENGGLHTGS